MEKNISIEGYINDLSSSKPTPGGGSAAALSAGLSSALTSMVFNLTIGKKAYENYNDEIKGKITYALRACEEYNKILLQFMKKDEEAFGSFMEVFKLPKHTEEEKLIRNEEIQKGYKRALEVPLNLAKSCIELYKYIHIASEYGNTNVVSDAGVGAILLYAAIESSILNVNVNLAGIKDENYKEQIIKECEKIKKEASDYRSKILDIVYSKIK
ncbi:MULTISPECIES: cyclodeaminase/cyclohydrolase family protein [Clostridium]|mgnify:CR=1 FL=1|uniref:Methenyltetrahydrofolate cyclohydrolase n=2 Tax=Clostridium TaxID=1485 RepID=A0A151ARX2_9CLOT|nr:MULTISPECIES: cyclodeaminase/cyclohydrolase family protein [Clostridium]KYH30137.1 methenyltetrahydrofolate cyclohydrolase [Clostridium colicanis DSM 13634]MBE6044633.1 cyclodeaminase/cyclohydrolase family protein [Clostridium thermopalmarium]PRR75445.1 Methenyltetrahydrofolate cyclohydrolase [Clostridium thermopalmarium DSM 5974]PVZ24347.1 formiminotetrahydrofolate cyclodeaminase [Clostridium thermopalmarium DSM 5974]